MVKLSRPSRLGLAGTALITLVSFWFKAQSSPTAGAAIVGTRRTATELPRIDLGRLEARHDEPTLGRRDIFDFGPAPTPAPVTAPSPAATSLPPLPPTPESPAAPSVPSLRLKYVGSLQYKGAKTAIFTVDDKEILVGPEGGLIANRVRILQIGLESVEILDEASSQRQRLPLKGNN